MVHRSASIVTSALLLLSGELIAQPCYEFHSVGGPTGGQLNGLCTDADGAVYIIGMFSDTLVIAGQTIAGAERNHFVAKLDAADQLVWYRVFSTELFSGAYAIVQDASGGVYVAGSFLNDLTFGTCTASHPGGNYTDVFLVKLNAIDGQCQWLYTGSSVGSAGSRSLAAHTDGTIRLAGGFWGYLTFGGTTLNCTGTSSPFVAAFASDGTPLWARQVVDPIGGSYGDVDVDVSGNTYAVGSHASTANLGNGITLTGSGAFIAKYDAAGVPVWGRQSSDTTAGNGFIGVACGNTDGAFVLRKGPLGVMKWDANGDTLWTSRWSGSIFSWSWAMSPPFTANDDHPLAAVWYKTLLKAGNDSLTSPHNVYKLALVELNTDGSLASLTGCENQGLSNETPSALDLDAFGGPVCGGMYSCTTSAPDTVLGLPCLGNGAIFYTRMLSTSGVPTADERTAAPVAYPLPFHDALTLRMPEGSAACAEHRLMDISGRVIHSERACGPVRTLRFPNELGDGVYLLQIISAAGSSGTIRVVHQ